MGKKKKSNTLNSKALQTVTNAYNKYGMTKNGKLKIKDKKKRKNIEGACCHSIITRKGKIKPKLYTETNPKTGQREQICAICRTSMSAKKIDNAEIKRRCRDFFDLNNRLKYLGLAAHIGPKAIDFFAEVGIIGMKYEKNAIRLNNIVMKHNEMKRKKSKDKTSEDFGSWQSIRKY